VWYIIIIIIIILTTMSHVVPGTILAFHFLIVGHSRRMDLDGIHTIAFTIKVTSLLIDGMMLSLIDVVGGWWLLLSRVTKNSLLDQKSRWIYVVCDIWLTS
jgi:prolipoprotein diacylglyceryltransferase